MAGAILPIEYQNSSQLDRRAKQLVGMTFREVLDLGIYPNGVVREYNSRRYKGGMGNLLEERFFGYRANSDREPDFAEAGVELKATCIDTRKDGREVAGERLVLTMIPYDEEIPESLYDSHLWHKCHCMLLVWYRRDRARDPYDQEIAYTFLSGSGAARTVRARLPPLEAKGFRSVVGGGQWRSAATSTNRPLICARFRGALDRNRAGRPGGVPGHGVAMGRDCRASLGHKRLMFNGARVTAHPLGHVIQPTIRATLMQFSAYVRVWPMNRSAYCFTTTTRTPSH